MKIEIRKRSDDYHVQLAGHPGIAATHGSLRWGI